MSRHEAEQTARDNRVALISGAVLAVLIAYRLIASVGSFKSKMNAYACRPTVQTLWANNPRLQFHYGDLDEDSVASDQDVRDLEASRRQCHSAAVANLVIGLVLAAVPAFFFVPAVKRLGDAA